MKNIIIFASILVVFLTIGVHVYASSIQEEQSIVVNHLYQVTKIVDGNQICYLVSPKESNNYYIYSTSISCVKK